MSRRGRDQESGRDRDQEPDRDRNQESRQDDRFWGWVAILLSITGVLTLLTLVLGVLLHNRSEKGAVPVTPTIVSTLTPTVTPTLTPSPTLKFTPTSFFCTRTPSPFPCPLENQPSADAQFLCPLGVDCPPGVPQLRTTAIPSSPEMGEECLPDNLVTPLVPRTPPLCGGTSHP
jgi:hypothetical protein